MEGRDRTKGNLPERNALRTQGREGVHSALERVRQVAIEERKQRFTALLHDVYDIDRLWSAYLVIKRDAAAGIDGEAWGHYGKDLEGNLQDQSLRLKRGAYRAGPVRREFIPKGDGGLRPLGVPVLEDKIVQRAVVEVLNAVYQEDFLGFRPKRSPHQASDALTVGVEREKVKWVLDSDLRSFFDTLKRAWLVHFIEQRVADKRIVRLIQKWLAAGVLQDGKRIQSEVGTVQGGSVSPLLLANIYVHYVFDLCVQRWRQKQARGDVIMVRFTDAFVVEFEHQVEAQRFLTELREKFARFDLELHPEKTRLIEFGRRARRNREDHGDRGAPGSFNFLGFTHSCGKTRKGGFTVLRQTMSKRLQAKLWKVKAELKRRMHEPISTVGKCVRAVVRGHIRYYGVPMNGPALGAFRREVGRVWWLVLHRRSQGNHLPWRRMLPLIDTWLPPAHFCDPNPLVRLGVITQVGSRMRQCCSSGSVEGGSAMIISTPTS
jgi:RNA-directed DNA polymerase